MIISYELTALCDAPRGLNVSYKEPTVAKLSWTPIQNEQHIITGYGVRVKGPTEDYTIDASANSAKVQVIELTPFTLYTFSVCAKSKMCTGLEATIESETPEAGKVSMICMT